MGIFWVVFWGWIGISYKNNIAPMMESQLEIKLSSQVLYIPSAGARHDR